MPWNFDQAKAIADKKAAAIKKATEEAKKAKPDVTWSVVIPQVYELAGNPGGLPDELVTCAFDMKCLPTLIPKHLPQYKKCNAKGCYFKPLPASAYAAVSSFTTASPPVQTIAIIDYKAELTVTAIIELSDDEHEIHITAKNIGFSTWDGGDQVRLRPVLSTDADEYLEAGYESPKKKTGPAGRQKKGWVIMSPLLTIPNGQSYTFKFVVKKPPAKAHAASKSVIPPSPGGYGPAGAGANFGSANAGLGNSTTVATKTEPKFNFYMEWISDQVTFIDPNFKDFGLSLMDKLTKPSAAEQILQMNVEATKKILTVADVGVDSASGLGMAKAKEADYKSLLTLAPQVAPKVQEVKNAIATLKKKQLEREAKKSKFTATSAYDYFFNEDNFISSKGFPDLNKVDKFRLMTNRLWTTSAVVGKKGKETFTTCFAQGSTKFNKSLVNSFKDWSTKTNRKQDFTTYHLLEVMKSPAYKDFPISHLYHLVIVDAIASVAEFSIDPKWSDTGGYATGEQKCKSAYKCVKCSHSEGVHYFEATDDGTANFWIEQCEKQFLEGKGEVDESKPDNYQSIRIDFVTPTGTDGLVFGPNHKTYKAINAFAGQPGSHFTLDYIKDIVVNLESEINESQRNPQKSTMSPGTLLSPRIYEDYSFRFKSFNYGAMEGNSTEQSKTQFKIITDYNFSTKESLNPTEGKNERALPFAYSSSFEDLPVEEMGYVTNRLDVEKLKTVLLDRKFLSNKNGPLFGVPTKEGLLKELRGMQPYQIKLTLPSVKDPSSLFKTEKDPEVYTRKALNVIEHKKIKNPETMFRTSYGLNYKETYRTTTDLPKVPSTINSSLQHITGGVINISELETKDYYTPCDKNYQCKSKDKCVAGRCTTPQNLTYNKLISGELSKVELLGYRIIKHRDQTTATSPVGQDVIQSFYVPGPGSAGETIKIMDSQIKYGEPYYYTPTALLYVHGTKYSYDFDTIETSIAIMKPQVPDTSWNTITDQVDVKCKQHKKTNGSSPIKTACASIEKCSIGNALCILKLIPDILTDYKKCLGVGCYKTADIPMKQEIVSTQKEMLTSLFQQEPKSNGVVPSITFRVKVEPAKPKMLEVPLIRREEQSPFRLMVEPPMPPISTITPYYGVSDKLLFRFQKGIGATKLIITHPESNWEQIKKAQVVSDSKLGHPDIKRDQLSSNEFAFTGVSKIATILVYRLETQPKSLDDFINKPPHAEIDLADSFLIENIEPNKKYYYVTKAINVHGAISYMSDIMRVELVDEGGTAFPIIESYKIPKVDKTSTSMQFKKALRIRPAFLQKAPNKIKEDLGFEDSSVFNDKNLFKFRITSNKTKRKIDINVKFTKKLSTVKGEYLIEPPIKGKKILEWKKSEIDATIDLDKEIDKLSDLFGKQLSICEKDSDCYLVNHKCRFGKCSKTDPASAAAAAGIFSSAEEVTKFMSKTAEEKCTGVREATLKFLRDNGGLSGDETVYAGTDVATVKCEELNKLFNKWKQMG